MHYPSEWTIAGDTGIVRVSLDAEEEVVLIFTPDDEKSVAIAPGDLSALAEVLEFARDSIETSGLLV